MIVSKISDYPVKISPYISKNVDIYIMNYKAANKK